MRLADYVIKFLESKKIDTVFTVSGGGSIFLCDALYKAKKLNDTNIHYLINTLESLLDSKGYKRNEKI